tara:strand:+ start:31828 stop:32952 length:1125 start_codon:yes stop_codon:yes gene_type:complete
MKKKIKVITVVGTRPEIIRLSCVIKKMEAHSSIDLILVHTGQNYDYELNQIFFKDLNLKPPKYKIFSKSSDTILTITEIIKKVNKIIKKEKPDAFFILGDTNSCLSAISAKKNKVPIFHFEAGNRCYDEEVPEEINRKIVDQISDINLTYSNEARQNLIREGKHPSTIFNIGSPMFEVINFHSKKINNSKIVKNLNLKKNKYILCSFHREENVENKRKLGIFFKLLDYLVDKYKTKILITCHPRLQNKLNKFNIKKNIIISKPLGFTDYVNLQINSMLVISDSGTISEETSILKFKSVNLRETHERHEAMENGTVPMTSFNFNQMINVVDNMIENTNKNLETCNDYNKENISEVVSRIILSYLNFTKKYIRKDN